MVLAHPSESLVGEGMVVHRECCHFFLREARGRGCCLVLCARVCTVQVIISITRVLRF